MEHSKCAINHIKVPTITSQTRRDSPVLGVQKRIKVERNLTTAQMNPKRGLVEGSIICALTDSLRSNSCTFSRYRCVNTSLVLGTKYVTVN